MGESPAHIGDSWERLQPPPGLAILDGNNFRVDARPKPDNP
jgi:hypothetical protein